MAQRRQSKVPGNESGHASGGAEEGEAAWDAFERRHDLWSDVLTAVLPKQKINPLRREMCQLLRLFVFGAVGNETKRGVKEKEKVLYEPLGTKEQIKMLFTIWDRLDGDNSGRVDITEFRSFVDKLVTEAKQPERRQSVHPTTGKKDHDVLPIFASGSPEDNAKFAARLCDRLAVALLGKKSSFVVEDLMRLIWPCAAISDLKQMKSWCEEFALSHARWRAPTPRLLPASELEALRAVFLHFDNDGSGTISVSELISSGLMDRETAQRYMSEVDIDGSGELDLREFCELMCPSGYRASEDAQKGTTVEGQRIVFDARIGGWRLEDANLGMLREGWI